MFDWKRKIEKKKMKGSQTAGITKPSCVATPFARFCATRSRAYKHKNYRNQLVAWSRTGSKGMSTR